MGELHLDVLIDRMVREFRVEANVGKPQVSYRETITRPARVDAEFSRQAGAKSYFGQVWLELAPRARGSGLHFENHLPDGKIPANFIQAVEQGVQGALESGTIMGYPVVDVSVSLVDARQDLETSTDQAFQAAAALALRKGLAEGNPVLMEPIMKLEVLTPAEYVGDVLGDLNSRRAQIGDMEMRSDLFQVIHATVPLSEMFGYATDLRSMTQGRGTFTMEFEHYAQLPEQRMLELTGGFGLAGR